MRKFIVLFYLFLTALSTHSWSEEASPEKEIMEQESRWSAMFAAGNLQGVMGLMAKKSALIMPGSAPLTSLDEIREATRAMMASGDEVSWESDFAAVAPSGDMAYDYGTAITRTAAGETITGQYLVVWVREDGGWKIAADMFN